MVNATSESSPKPSQTQRIRSLRARARLRLEDETLDSNALVLGKHGVSLIVSENLPRARCCDIQFELFVDGAARHVNARGEVTSCSCAGMDGFRVSVRFTKIDDGSANTINQLLHFG